MQQNETLASVRNFAAPVVIDSSKKCEMRMKTCELYEFLT
jgi:hypothetical protein